MIRSGGVPGAGPLFDRPAWRYALIFSLYLYQGVVAGFALTALPNHGAALGLPLEEIGRHAAVLGLPWVLQPLWGPVVDRFGDFRMGRRRFWVVVALAGSLAALAGLLLLDGPGGMPPSLAGFAPVLVVHGACAALLDTALDAMVIDRVPAEGLGRANACTRAGLVSGMALGAWIFAWLLPAHGLGVSALVLLGFGVAVAALALAVREAPGDARLSLRRRRAAGWQPDPAPSAAGLTFLRERRSLLLLAFCVAVEYAAAALGLRLGVAMLQAGGWEAAALSRLQGALGFAAGTLGALLVGRWVDRAGALRVLPALLGLCALSQAGVALLLLAAGDRPAGIVGAAAMALTVVLPALVFLALAPAIMRESRGPAAATRFALFMAALNLGSVAGAEGAGRLGAWLPLWGAALLAGLVFSACAALAGRPRLLFRQGDGPAP